MKVRIRERLQMIGILDPSGNMMTIAIQKDLKKKLELTQELMTAVGLKHEGDRVMWQPENDLPVEIEFTQAELMHLRKCAKEVDNQSRVTEENFDMIKMLLDAPPVEKLPEPKENDSNKI